MAKIKRSNACVKGTKFHLDAFGCIPFTFEQHLGLVGALKDLHYNDSISYLKGQNLTTQWLLKIDGH